MGCMELHRNVASDLQRYCTHGLYDQPYGHAVMERQHRQGAIDWVALHLLQPTFSQ
jgi:hypothetical protein